MSKYKNNKIIFACFIIEIMSLKTELLKIISAFPSILNKVSESNNLYRNVLNLVVKPLECVQNNARHGLSRIGALYDLVYQNLHTGEWHAVPHEEREVFTIVSFLRILYMILCSSEKCDSLEDAIYIADIGIMLGSKIIVQLENKECDLLSEVASILSRKKKTDANEPPLKKLKIELNCNESIRCDIPIAIKPTLEYFGSQHYQKRKPALLRGIIDDWPAMQKWHDLNYLVGLAGERTVPVEMGSQYSSDDWSQRLVKFKDFIAGNLVDVSNDDSEKNRAYLAQHELFEQIPELRNDIHVPDYIGRTDVNPRIKAWLGPKSTISPLHTDPSHNLLCQVFGSKTIILASPEDTRNLYPHEHFILNNTSRVDVKNVDYDQFPLVRKVKLLRLVLRRGEVLYIPPGWWHYVESLTVSFSVSFWFE